MTHIKFALAGVVALAIVASPTMAQGTAEDLKKAVEKLELATKDLKDTKDALKVDELRSKLISLETKIDLIDKDLSELRKDIRDIKRKLNDGGGYTALRPDTDSPSNRGLGRVRFINQFSEEMSVVVNNGRSRRLLPGQELLLTVPPGDFSYQVLQVQRFPRELRISADETKTIRIFPLP